MQLTVDDLPHSYCCICKHGRHDFYWNVHGIVAQAIVCEEGSVAATAKLLFVPQPLLQHWMFYWSSMWSIVMTTIVYDNNSMYIKQFNSFISTCTYTHSYTHNARTYMHMHTHTHAHTHTHTWTHTTHTHIHTHTHTHTHNITIVYRVSSALHACVRAHVYKVLVPCLSIPTTYLPKWSYCYDNPDSQTWHGDGGGEWGAESQHFDVDLDRYRKRFVYLSKCWLFIYIIWGVNILIRTQNLYII